MSEARLAFADQFPPASEADWRTLAERALQGASFDRKLVSKTLSGQRIEPIYPRPASASSQPTRQAGRWQIVQRVDHPDIGAANAQALSDLAGGTDALELVFASSMNALGGGLCIASLNELDRLLDGVMLDMISLRIDAGHHNRHMLAMLVALASRRGIAPEALDITLHVDVLGHALRNGRIAVSDGLFVARMRDAIAAMDRTGLSARLIMVEGKAVHDAGGSDEQELAFAAAGLVHYMRLLEQADVPIERLPAMLGVRMSADADQHMSVARFRSLRRIWAQLLDGMGLPQSPIFVHAETAWRMMTRNDPHVNLLRTTMATFAAGIGGADSVTVLPFSTALGLPDEFARRIARNTQSVLLEESNLFRVVDPAAGSGAIESLTADLTERAWARFQTIEAAGGLHAELCAGKLQNEIAEIARARQAQIATRRMPITGVSEFASLAEPVIRIDASYANELETSGQSIDLPPPGNGVLFEALVAATQSGVRLAEMAVSRGDDQPSLIKAARAIRLAEPFEALRLAALRQRADTGAPPQLHIAQLGQPAEFQARVSFTTNAVAAGGIACQLGEPCHTAHDAADEFRAGGLQVVCICSSDEVYNQIGLAAAEALRSAGASHVFVARRPGDLEDAWRGAGVTDFIFSGGNLLAFLNELHAALGVTQQSGEAGREKT